METLTIKDLTIGTVQPSLEKLNQVGYKVLEQELPPPDAEVTVLTAGYRCVAKYVGAVWRCAGTNEVLSDVIAWRPIGVRP